MHYYFIYKIIMLFLHGLTIMIMKSLLRIFTVLAVCFVTFSAEGAEQFVNFNGDGWLLNKDGKVNIRDVTYGQRYLAGFITEL